MYLVAQQRMPPSIVANILFNCHVCIIFSIFYHVHCTCTHFMASDNLVTCFYLLRTSNTVIGQGEPQADDISLL